MTDCYPSKSLLRFDVPLSHDRLVSASRRVDYDDTLLTSDSLSGMSDVTTTTTPTRFRESGYSSSYLSPDRLFFPFTPLIIIFYFSLCMIDRHPGFLTMMTMGVGCVGVEWDFLFAQKQFDTSTSQFHLRAGLASSTLYGISGVSNFASETRELWMMIAWGGDGMDALWWIYGLCACGVFYEFYSPCHLVQTE